MFELQLTAKAYAGRPVLGALRLQLSPGQRLALLGPSGIGKSTLLNIVAGLDTEFSGTRRCAAELRIGYLFQEPRLLPWRTVAQNLRLVGAEPQRIDALLGEVGLPDVADLYPRQLSLGMARRVALARALAFDPDLLLLDEPTASLDGDTADAMRTLLTGVLQRRPELALVLVSHDPRDAERLTGQQLTLAAAAPRPPLERAGITTK